MKHPALPLLFAVVAGSAMVCAPVAAHAVIYVGTLSGANEAPANASPGTGTGRLTLDDHLQTLRVEFSFAGLLGNVTAAHIHCCTPTANSGTAGVATTTPTFSGMVAGENLGVGTGAYVRTFDMTQAASWNAAFLNAAPRHGSTSLAFATLASAIGGGHAYLNLHSSVFPGGEIRTFFTPAPVPEPASLALMLAGLAGVALAARRRVRT